jgi:hypothetical protein
MGQHSVLDRKTRLQKAIEREYGRPWWAVLGELLYERRFTVERTARKLGTVSLWSRDPRVEGGHPHATASQPRELANGQTEAADVSHTSAA